LKNLNIKDRDPVRILNTGGLIVIDCPFFSVLFSESPNSSRAKAPSAPLSSGASPREVKINIAVMSPLSYKI